ncbi:regulatory signaling modulator protein AmpE [Thalassolituus sp.]|uniref:regulatory signaling modulator protein AmpE n=1 Tax=Thalassolituus sp. TaxID=2030822 RepID=UPI0035197FFF
MKFLVLFVVLLWQIRFPLPHRSTSSRTFARWLGALEKLPGFYRFPRHTRYALVVVLPTVVITLTMLLADPYAFGLLSVALKILLLLYVLSHMSIGKHLQAYRSDLRRGDTQGAYHCAEQYLAVPEVNVTDDLEAMNHQVIRALLHRWFEYFFLMVFWYMVADVAGILLAWFSLQYARATRCDAEGWRYLHWIEWIPVRLLGLTYGLAGNFLHAFPVWHSYLWNRSANSSEVLYRVAEESLESSAKERRWHSVRENSEVAAAELDEWQRLHIRSLSVWMVIIAAATVGGLLL